MTPRVTTEPAEETSLAIDVVPTGDGGEPRLRFRGRNGNVLEVTGNLAHLQQLASAAIKAYAGPVALLSLSLHLLNARYHLRDVVAVTSTIV